MSFDDFYIDNTYDSINHKLEKCLLLKQPNMELSNINHLFFINELFKFNWITELVLVNCEIIELSIFLPNLEKLNASNNMINTIIHLPETLKKLNISNNNITVLDNLPINLNSLDTSSNKIHTIYDDIINLVSLTEINLCNNNLSKIPMFNNQLLILDISKNNLSSIENLPDSLIELDISKNEIVNIDSMPPKLEKIIAYLNNISCVTIFPNTLKYIDISYNELIWIAECPPNLEYLDVSSNKLKTININFPQSLHTLDVSENEIINDEIFKYCNIKNLKYDSLEDIIYVEDDNEINWQNLDINLPSYEDVVQENMRPLYKEVNFDNMDMSLFDSIKENITKIILKNHYVV